MGVQPHQGAGYMDVNNPEVIEGYHKFYGVPVPLGEGLKIPEMFDAALDSKLKGMWIIGEDLAQTDPNTKKSSEVAKELRYTGCSGTIHDRNGFIS